MYVRLLRRAPLAFIAAPAEFHFPAAVCRVILILAADAFNFEPYTNLTRFKIKEEESLELHNDQEYLGHEFTLVHQHILSILSLSK